MALRPRTIAAALGLLALALISPGSPVVAQTTGEARFHVYVQSTDIGTLTSTVTREDTGWMITGGGMLGDPLKLELRQLEMHYDAAWHPLRITFEQVQADDSAVVHVAFGLADGETRTDIVRPNQALWGSNKVAADTIPLPDFVYASYEVLAARLETAKPGAEFKVFVVPRFEAILHVDSVDDQSLRMESGTIGVKRWRTTMQRPEGPAPVHVWTYGGRLYRLDFPKEEITVIREDVLERR